MAIQYKRKCRACNKNYVIVGNRTRSQYIICAECQKKDMQGEITDPKLKKMFDIPDNFYEKSGFLRNIKISYLRYGSLSEKQIEAFNNTVERLKKEAKSAQENPKIEK